MNDDIKILIELLNAEGRPDISEIFQNAVSELRVSDQYGSYLFSLISSFLIYLPPKAYVKAKKLKEEDIKLILELVCGIYPLQDNEPEVVKIEFIVQKNYSTQEVTNQKTSNSRKELYSLKGLIGDGGFAEVFEAVGKDGKIYAMKFLREGHDEEDIKRFKREVRIQSTLKHNNIVSVIDMDLEADSPWFLMPKAYFNLEDYLKKNYGEREIPLFFQIAEGVSFAHSQGIIHRDLKPLNVLMFPSQDGESLFPAISDFGLGKIIEGDSPAVTYSNTPIGTIGFVAPEQIVDAKNARESADIYSLGKILYQILSGKNPYPSLDFESFPKKFFYSINKATNNDPKQRYQSVKEFLGDIELLTKKDMEFEESSESILKRADELKETSRVSSEEVEKFVKTLFDITENKIAMIRTLPKIPELLLKRMVEEQPTMFREILKSYESYIDEVSFEYCDVVADLYKKIFFWTNDKDVQFIVLKRLPILGLSHNRWHVGEVFAELVQSLKEESLILFTRDVLNENKRGAEWCEAYLSRVNIPKLVRNIYTK